MRKLCLLAAMFVVCAGSGAMLFTPVSASAGKSPDGENLAESDSRLNSGAFRDGLFLGKFSAERGLPYRVVSGRWATAENRVLFATGYAEGYDEFVASRGAAAGGEHLAADCTTTVQRTAGCELSESSLMSRSLISPNLN